MVQMPPNFPLTLGSISFPLNLNLSNLDVRVEVEGRGTVGLEEEGVAIEGGVATEREVV